MRPVEWIEKNTLERIDRWHDPSMLVIQIGLTSYDDGSEEPTLYHYVDGQWLADPIDDTLTHEH